ncbi:MAG: ABC transporter substrate-binding protein [Clostridiales bacterium]|nr:ABC transporter substrate-binding protein [Clostridiales bacterium]
MKKTMRKVLAAAVVLVMVITCFAACGGKGGNVDGDGDGKTILIGGTGPLTGDASSYGISAKNGAEIAIKEINEAGGLNGTKLLFDMKDDKATPEDASTGYDALMDAGMKISLGSVTSGSCAAFADKAASDNLFFITPSASAANVIEKGTNAFRVCFGDPDQGVLAAQELTKTYKNIGCIYDTSDPYSSGIFDAFKGEMEKLGASFILQTFDAENKKDFSTQAEALKGCDVVFTPFYYTEAGLVAKALVAKGSQAVVFGCDGLDGIADQIEGVNVKVMYITPFDANNTSDVVTNFVKAYQNAYGTTPDQFAADGYDAVYAIFNAMKAAGVTADMSVSDICDAVVKAITDPSFKLEGATGTMTWDATGACTKAPQIVELNNN